MGIALTASKTNAPPENAVAKSPNSLTKFVVVGAYPESVVSFRGELISSAARSGREVTVMAGATDAWTADTIRRLGAQFRDYPVGRNSMNPVGDLATLRALRTAFHEIRPDVILAYTIKPVIWGGIAARKVPNAKFFALVTGLGYAFQGNSLKRKLLSAIVVRLYRFALKRATGVIFQNTDNRDLFIAKKIVPADKCHVVNGSGVNVAEFAVAPLPDGPPRFLLIARLLGEKGIREYRNAAEIVRKKYPDATFELVGPTDPSPDGISIDEVQQWNTDGIIQYSGATADVRPFIANCHVYVLPSYHEGMPRTVLEAMSMGRPILTTDVSGCRETVIPDSNGWLVPKADAASLSEKMIWFIENRTQWSQMGAESRRIAEGKFDVRRVNEAMMKILGME